MYIKYSKSQIKSEGKKSKAIRAVTPSGPRTDDLGLNAEGFPLDALPPIARAMVRSVSRSYRTPVALAAGGVLGIGSSAVGKGLVVRALLDMDTPANLYIVFGAPPGAGKSLVLRPINKPLQDVEQRARVLSLNPDVDLSDEPNGTTKAATRAARIQTDDVVKRWFENRPATESKVPPALMVDDTTPIAMARAFHANGECLGSISADARDPINRLTGISSAGGLTQEGIYLKAFSEDPIIINRVKETITLHAPSLSLMWFTQPDMIDALLVSPALAQGGFLSRCLMAKVEMEPQCRGDASVPLSAKASREWEQLVRGLLRDYRVGLERKTVSCSAGARRVFAKFDAETVNRQADELRDVQNHVIRWQEQAIRVALVLHALTHGPKAHRSPLRSRTAADAVRIVEWFNRQQLELLTLGREIRLKAQEEMVLGLLSKAAAGMTARELQQRRVAATAGEVGVVAQTMITKKLLRAVTGDRPRNGGHTPVRYCLELPGRPKSFST